MDWLQFAVPNPWLPNLTISVLLWTTAFAVAMIYFIRLTRRAWASYRYNINNLTHAERLFALGKLVSYSDSLLIVSAGLLTGILVAAGPHTVTHFDLRDIGITVALLIIPLGKLMQGFLMQYIFNKATEALRYEAINEREKQNAQG